MIQSLLIGIGGMITLMFLWVFVQSWWKQVFEEDISDVDVLAGRSSCSNCGCGTICKQHTGSVSSKEFN